MRSRTRSPRRCMVSYGNAALRIAVRLLVILAIAYQVPTALLRRSICCISHAVQDAGLGDAEFKRVSLTDGKSASLAQSRTDPPEDERNGRKKLRVLQSQIRRLRMGKRLTRRTPASRLIIP